MMLSRRIILAAPAVAAGLVIRSRAGRAQGALIRFGVGPLQPTPGDTRRVYEPFFAHLANALGRPFDLVSTTDWAGIAIALANEQVDVAWMGPWGYVIARDKSGCEALTVVKYNGKPTYQGIIMARPDTPIVKFPEDARGMTISFTDAGSTSGWLIPHYWFKTQGIDPRSSFKYRDGATHAAQSIAVISGQVDLATDFDRNLDAMIANGRVRREQVKVVWRSEPLPNDALAVRKGIDAETRSTIVKAALGIDAEAAKTILPPNYTGWIAAKPDSYALIETAGRTLGKLG
jgi:phosphonate transport system substrate-binding protein